MHLMLVHGLLYSGPLIPPATNEDHSGPLPCPVWVFHPGHLIVSPFVVTACVPEPSLQDDASVSSAPFLTSINSDDDNSSLATTDAPDDCDNAEDVCER